VVSAGYLEFPGRGLLAYKLDARGASTQGEVEDDCCLVANLASQRPQLACKPKHQRFKETVGAPQHPKFDLKTLKEDSGQIKYVITRHTSGECSFAEMAYPPLAGF